MKNGWKRFISLMLCLVMCLTLLPEKLHAANSAVMTADEFISYLNTALNRKTKYNNNYPYNVGYYDGTYISWDCWHLGETIIATRGQVVNNYTTGAYASAWTDSSIGLTGQNGDWLKSACSETLSTDFSSIAPGEWLFRDNSSGSCYHVGYYIGNQQVIEITSDGTGNVQKSTIDSSGHSNLRGSSWTWTSHAKVPWIVYCAHNYSGGQCTICNEWQPNMDDDYGMTPDGTAFAPGTYKVKSGVTAYLREGHPYQKAEPHIELSAGTQMYADKSVLNGAGNVWYHVQYNSKWYWCYAPNLELVSADTKITISGQTKPSGDLPLNKGFSLQGIITSYPKLSNVTVQIIDRTTGQVVSGFNYSTNPNSTTYNIQTGGADKAIVFSNLPTGNYRYVVKATNASVGTKTLVSSDFTMGGGVSTTTNPVAPNAPSVSVSGQNVTVSWNDVANETRYDVYLLQAPWGWEDIKYSASVGTGANVYSYTFTNVAYGDYAAFVISRPNEDWVQSEWTSFAVVAPKYDLDLNGMIDGVETWNFYGVGTCDVYINGALQATGYDFNGANWVYGTTYEIKNIQPAEGYSYDGVSNIAYDDYVAGGISGTITGNTSVRLIFNTSPMAVSAPTITAQPTNQVVDLGKNYTFAVKATGVGLSYTWYYKFPGESGFTKSSITTASYTNVGKINGSGMQMYCVVKDKFGNSVTSNTATLFVYGAPCQIVEQPQNQAVNLNATYTFTCGVAGEGLSYTWYYKFPGDAGFTRSSCTTASYSNVGKINGSGMQMYCVVRDKHGNTATSRTATLFVYGAPCQITEQPQNQTVNLNASYTFTCGVAGEGLSYAWYYKFQGDAGFTKSSCTTASYTNTARAASNGMQMYCVVRDKNGNTKTSRTATLTVNGIPCQIVQQPQNQAVNLNATYTFSCGASGEGLSYTWYYKFPGESGFTKSSCTTASYSNVGKINGSGMQMYCVVRDKYGNTKTSRTATLFVYGAPCQITEQPTSKTVHVGDSYSFTCGVAGEGLSYAWYYKFPGDSGFTKSSATGASYTNTARAGSNGLQMYCVVTDKHGNTKTSNTVTLTVK